MRTGRERISKGTPETTFAPIQDSGQRCRGTGGIGKYALIIVVSHCYKKKRSLRCGVPGRSADSRYG